MRGWRAAARRCRSPLSTSGERGRLLLCCFASLPACWWCSVCARLRSPRALQPSRGPLQPLPPPARLPRRLGDKPSPIPADDPLCIYCQRTPNANARALARFIDYASSLPDVWFVTASDLVRGRAGGGGGARIDRYRQ